jgi:hypothetical protein
MKTFLSFCFLLAFIGLLFIGCSDKSLPTASPTDPVVNTNSGSLSLEKMTETTFTGREDPIDFAYGKVVGEGSRLVEKGIWFKSIVTSNLPLLNNVEAEYTFNVSFNDLGEGPMKGKFTMTVGGGTLEGTVEGKMFAVSEDEMQGIFKYVGQGKGGIIDGLKLFCTETYYESKSYAYYPYGDLVGYIK